MKDEPKPYTIIKLHDFDERCWGVVDAKGALIDIDGLSMRLTKPEAQAIANEINNGDRAIPLTVAGDG